MLNSACTNHTIYSHTLSSQNRYRQKYKRPFSKVSHLRKGQDVTGIWCLITGSSPLCRGLTLPLLQARPLTSCLRDFHSSRGKPRLTSIRWLAWLSATVTLHKCSAIQKGFSTCQNKHARHTCPLSQTKRELSQAAQWILLRDIQACPPN